MATRKPVYNIKLFYILLLVVTGLFMNGSVLYMRNEVLSSTSDTVFETDVETVVETVVETDVDIAITGDIEQNEFSPDDSTIDEDQWDDTPVMTEEQIKSEESTSKKETPDLITTPVKSETRAPKVDKDTPLFFNQLVLATINTYNSGSYPYLLNTDYANYNGVTMNLYYEGRILLKAHPSGNRANHCVGITFEVFFRAMKEWNKQKGLPEDTIKDLSYDQLFDFILTWYVAGPKKDNNLAIALEKYGLGKRIHDFEDARPGDFIDFSRENQTGHAVVFIDWVRDNGKIIGLRYWSTQQSTKGIGYRTEYFNVLRSNGTKYGNIMKDHVYIGRVWP